MQSQLPKVSVLIPAYNEENYIIATLEALLVQVQSKYGKAFFQSIFYKSIRGQQSIEVFHPR